MPRVGHHDMNEEVDVVIIGGGPAGSLLAYLLAERHNRSVALIDPRASERWPNNYGVWLAEWDALEEQLKLNLTDCLHVKWDFTDCYLGGSWNVDNDHRLRIPRPYARVDREKLKARLRSEKVQVIQEPLDAQAIAPNIFQGPGLRHDATGSIVTLPSGRLLRAKLVVDASGSESRLTRRIATGGDVYPKPGYQIAYGFECVVDGNLIYDTKAMTLFDYRTNFFASDPDWEKRAEKEPTFMYTMPLGPVAGEPGAYHVFFEETSLVARPALSFEECQKRAFARLKHLGIRVRQKSITEEEFCYIPMGGPLPEPGQRVAAFGGAAVMVHPSTGYQLCRMMATAKDASEVIAKELDKALEFSPDVASAAVYESIWSAQRQAQRDFAVFGGEFLMELNVRELRGWFGALFELPEELWAGFLAGWPGLPGNQFHEHWAARISFGIQLTLKIPFTLVIRLAAAIIKFTSLYGTSLLRSVSPGLGQPSEGRYRFRQVLLGDEVGDPNAKREAARLAAKGPPQRIN